MYFYKRLFPEKDELVVGEIIVHDKTEFKCRLLEYNKLEINCEPIKKLKTFFQYKTKKVFRVMYLESSLGDETMTEDIPYVTTRGVTNEDENEKMESYEKRKQIVVSIYRACKLINKNPHDMIKLHLHPLDKEEKDVYAYFKNFYETVNKATITDEFLLALYKLLEEKFESTQTLFKFPFHAVSYEDIDYFKKIYKNIQSEYNFTLISISPDEYSMLIFSYDEIEAKEKYHLIYNKFKTFETDTFKCSLKPIMIN